MMSLYKLDELGYNFYRQRRVLPEVAMQLSHVGEDFEAPEQTPDLQHVKDETEEGQQSETGLETAIANFEQANEESLTDELASLHQAIVDRYKLEETKGKAEEFTENLKVSLENVGDKKLFSAFGVTVTARDAIILTASQALGRYGVPLLLATTNINGALASVLIGGAIGGMGSGLRASKMVEREYLAGAGWEAKINEVDDPKVQLEMVKFLLSDPEVKKYFQGNAEEAWGLLALYQTIAKTIETQEIVDIIPEQAVEKTGQTAREVIANHLKDKSDEQRNEFWRAFGNGAVRAMAFSTAFYSLGALLGGTPAYGAGSEHGQSPVAQDSRIGAELAVAGTATAVFLSFTPWGRKLIDAGREKLSEIVGRRRGRTTETAPATPAQPRDREARIESFTESLQSLSDESEGISVTAIITRLDQASQLMKKTKVEKEELAPLAADLIQIGDVLREKGTFKEITRGHQTYSQEKVRPNLDRQYTVGLVTLLTNGEVHINARDDKGNLVFWTPSAFLKNVDTNSFRPVEPETDDRPPVLNENLLEPNNATTEDDANKRTAEYIEGVRRFDPLDVMPDAAMRNFKDVYLIGKVGDKPTSLVHIKTPDDGSDEFIVETADLTSADKSFRTSARRTADTLNDLMDHSDGKTYEIYGNPEAKIGPPLVDNLLVETLGAEQTQFNGNLEEAAGRYNDFDVITFHNNEPNQLSHVTIADPERKMAEVTSTSLTRREDPTTSQWSVAALVRLTEGQVEIHVNPESEYRMTAEDTIAKMIELSKQYATKPAENIKQEIEKLTTIAEGHRLVFSEVGQELFEKRKKKKPNGKLAQIDLEGVFVLDSVDYSQKAPHLKLIQEETGAEIFAPLSESFLANFDLVASATEANADSADPEPEPIVDEEESEDPVVEIPEEQPTEMSIGEAVDRIADVLQQEPDSSWAKEVLEAMKGRPFAPNELGRQGITQAQETATEESSLKKIDLDQPFEFAGSFVQGNVLKVNISQPSTGGGYAIPASMMNKFLTFDRDERIEILPNQQEEQ